MSSGMLLVVMGGLFLLLGYMGVPVAFAIIAGVLVATAFTPISFQSMIGQLFHGIDSEALLAVPFFLLVGELMSSANVVYRMIGLDHGQPDPAVDHGGGLRRHRQRVDRRIVPGRRGAGRDDRRRPDDLQLFLRARRHIETARQAGRRL